MSTSNNTLAFIALSNEYCSAIENANQSERAEFVDSMTRLLPRIYITASDIPEPSLLDDGDVYVNDALDEDYYDSMRRNVETVLGEDDTYLEVFEEDMKYSDTPIGASVSEGLADIFQVLFNYLETVREAPSELIEPITATVREDFANYWSQKLCNVLRAINTIKYSHD
jgi:hypothetical protein